MVVPIQAVLIDNEKDVIIVSGVTGCKTLCQNLSQAYGNQALMVTSLCVDSTGQ
jgi:hypothetical protein